MSDFIYLCINYRNQKRAPQMNQIALAHSATSSASSRGLNRGLSSGRASCRGLNRGHISARAGRSVSGLAPLLTQLLRLFSCNDKGPSHLIS